MKLPLHKRNIRVNLAKPAWIVCRHGREFYMEQAGSDWDFVCLADRPSEDWHLPLRTDWPGWRAILESFFLMGRASQ